MKIPQEHNPYSCSDVIESFAAICEELSAYSRHLRNSKTFRLVKAQEGIRNYQSGWRLEKWLEAPLNEEMGLWACWWIELGFAEGAYIVDSSVSISHSDFHLQFPSRSATSVDALRQALAEAVSELKNALEDNLEFKSQVEELHQV